MKLKFTATLDYQKQAVESICDIFSGQEHCHSNFSVAPMYVSPQLKLGFDDDTFGYGNRLKLLNEDILENVNQVQLSNGLKLSKDIRELSFTVEMETGTGKTYVYLRTILELNRRYGFNKFIIVVPSVAVKEGVAKSLEITESHFRGLYDNLEYSPFVYNSSQPNQIRDFATSDHLQIMVINIDAFRRKDFTRMHQESEKLAGLQPVQLIGQTNPIVIIDEPQSVDNTEKSKEAIASLNPLCTLRYSATHVDKYNMMYRLDSVDAYERKLVKQIEVAGIEVEGSHNKAYIKLIKVDDKNGDHKAQVELDVLQQNGVVKRKKQTVRPGEPLLEASGGRDAYDGYIINDIYCEKGKEYVDFTSQPDVLKLNEAVGEVDDGQYKRLQIRKTIEEHLNKELQLRPQGIKVLSLFFIDKVANYRGYDKDGNPQPGKYAVWFEEEYKAIIQKGKYKILFEGADLETAADGVHNGYFAIDKKKDSKGDGRFKESTGEGKTQSDESAYRLIMKDKEDLLSLDTKLKFIFSHSALREGWDNPNVFQICTLNETTSVMKKRQEIGRGLRICVNQDGERVWGFDINRLTVMANESYEDFAAKLQKEIEEDTGIKFGFVEDHQFANIRVPGENGEDEHLGVDKSKLLWEHLKEKGYIDQRGKVQDSLKDDLKNERVDIPEEFNDQKQAILQSLRKVAGDLNIKNAGDRRPVKLNKAVYLSPEFHDLWNRIKHRTTFRVDFDCEKLIEECAKDIERLVVVPKARFIYRKGTIDKIDRGGVQTGEEQKSTHVYEAKDFPLPDIVSFLQNATNLSRRSIVRILIESKTLDRFKKNPQKYIEGVTKVIDSRMQTFIVDGIKYQKIGGQEYFAQELFEGNELAGYLNKNMQKAKKSVFDHVIYDSDVESTFAKEFEANDEVKIYAKLPPTFQISTPLGPYNPDWAVLIDTEEGERVYFVVESKGGLFPEESMRAKEKAKARCGEQHFKALETDVEFCVESNYEKFSERLS